MKTSILVLIVSIIGAGTASAQVPAGTTPTPRRGYAEAVAQSAFGNATTQSYGGEIGVALRPKVQVYIDVGRVRDVAPAALRARAQIIAGGIAAVTGNVDTQVQEPAAFGVAGLKFPLSAPNGRIEPYLLVGAGVANLSKNVTFSTTAGAASQFATLGGDLSGSERRLMVSAGGGVGVPIGPALIIDLQYRYGRIFASDTGINVHRAGIGIGVRF